MLANRCLLMHHNFSNFYASRSSLFTLIGSFLFAEELLHRRYERKKKSNTMRLSAVPEQKRQARAKIMLH